MHYTVWSKGQLLGHSDLGFMQCLPLHRMGWFHPIADAEKVIEVMNDPRRVILHANVAEDAETVCADLEATCNRALAVELELRGPDGEPVPTEDLAIIDTALTKKFAARADAEEMFAAPRWDESIELEELDFPDEEEDDELPDLPRYQLMVCFAGHEAAMLKEVEV